jgi:hypothetical protein
VRYIIMDNNLDNKEKLKEMIASKSYSLLGLTSYYYPTNKELLNDLIELSIKYEDIEALLLIYEPTFTFTFESLDDTMEHLISNEILKQEKYDFIVPCVLASLTTMTCISDSFFTYKQKNFLDYLKNHPQLKLNRQFCYDNLNQLFEKSDDLDLIQIISKDIKWDNSQVFNCLKTCLKSKNFKGIDYLINEPLVAPIMTQLMFKWSEEILDIPTHHDLDIKTLARHINFSYNSNDFIINIISTLKNQFNLVINDKSMEHFSYPLVSNIRHNAEEVIYQFLTQFYALDNQTIPKHAITYVEGWERYNHFSLYCEKKQLESEINTLKKSDTKIKL